MRSPLSLPVALVVLRVTVALLFIAHGAVRIANGSIPQFGAFLEARHLPRGEFLVWCITIYELVAGLLLALGRKVVLTAAGFFGILAVGIVLIHGRIGWFVGEHGTGGCEYSVALMAALLVIAASDRSATASLLSSSRT